jgi:hypothetical protein
VIWQAISFHRPSWGSEPEFGWKNHFDPGR